MFRVCRGLGLALCGGVLGAGIAVGAMATAPAALASCANGFVQNPYTAQCLAPVSTPIINGVPCVASKIALCSSFVQNQQPRPAPRPVG